MDEQTRFWIESTLKNDEESSDAGLVDYFMHGGITREEALKAVSQRDDCLNDMFYEVEF
jgi:hypothetical protein